jgi:propanol-preferring alcohol dehydrogenase
MLSVRYLGPNQNFQLNSVPVPILGEGEVLVELKAAALCHTELHFLDGTLNLGVTDIAMGHEAAGIIIAVGGGVDAARIGERVVVYYYIGCGNCRYCRVGNEQLCPKTVGQHGFTTDGGLAGCLKTISRNAVQLPDTIASFEIAATIGCGVTTAVHASKLAEIQEGEWIAVFGVNGVGFNLIQLAKTYYKAKVIAVCRSQQKRIKAIELSADAVVDASDMSTVASQIREITEGDGADVIFECVGNRQSMDQVISIKQFNVCSALLFKYYDIRKE